MDRREPPYAAFSRYGVIMRAVRVGATAALLFAIAGTASGVGAEDSGRTEMVDQTPEGQRGNSDSWDASLSRHGRFVAFVSASTNLVAGDTNDANDVFVRDMKTQKTRRVSVGMHGEQANEGSYEVTISANGRYVAFTSVASNLVPDDTNGVHDVFLRDLRRHTTVRVSVTKTGEQLAAGAVNAAMSASGQHVAFRTPPALSRRSETDLFLRDMGTGRVEHINVDSSGERIPGQSAWPSMSFNGRFVAFTTEDVERLEGRARIRDVYLRDRRRGTTTLVSVRRSGRGPANDDSAHPFVSKNGRYVAFSSYAHNIVPRTRPDDEHVYRRDMLTGRTEVVDMTPAGKPSRYGTSGGGALSGNGRFVLFNSSSPDLRPDGKNDPVDVFVRNMRTDRVHLVGLSDKGQRPSRYAWGQDISADGEIVAFRTDSLSFGADDWHYLMFTRRWR